MATYSHAAPCPTLLALHPCKMPLDDPRAPQCSVLTVDGDSSKSLGASMLDFGLGKPKSPNPSPRSACGLGHSTTRGSVSPAKGKKRFLPEFSLPGLAGAPSLSLSVTSLPMLSGPAASPGPPSPSCASLSSWRRPSLSRPTQHFPGRPPASGGQQLSGEQKSLVRDTWQAAISRDLAVAPPGAQTPALDLFGAIYAHLFALCPEAKLILGTHVRMCVKLARAIGLLLHCLDTPQRLREVLRSLAGRHVSAGVTPSMFGHLGTALCVGLSQRLGPMWTPAVAEAWLAFYNTASAMLQGEMAQLLADSEGMALWLADQVAGQQPAMVATWAAMGTTTDAFSSTFYMQFLAACPDAKPLFERAHPPHAALHTVLANLLRVVDQPAKLATQLRGVGRLHAGLGLAPGMNTHFRTCFVAALQAHVPGLDRDEAGAWGLLVGMVGGHVVASSTHRGGRRREACTVS